MKPSDVLAEVHRLPCGMLERIVEYRHIAAAIAANTTDQKGWASSPMRTMCMEIEMELAAEEIARG
jgi:hypothetical protein